MAGLRLKHPIRGRGFLDFRNLLPMARKVEGLLLALLVLLVGCGTTGHFRIASDNALPARYDSGRVELTSDHVHQVQLRFFESTFEWSGGGTLYLRVTNNGKDPFTFSPENVRVRFYDPSKRLAGIHVGLGKGDDGLPEVGQIIPDGPADKDGRLQVGDTIIGIGQEGSRIKEIRLEQGSSNHIVGTQSVLRALTGRPGTDVWIRVKVAKTDEIKVYRLTRQLLHVDYIQRSQVEHVVQVRSHDQLVRSANARAEANRLGVGLSAAFKSVSAAQPTIATTNGAANSYGRVNSNGTWNVNGTGVYSGQLNGSHNSYATGAGFSTYRQNTVTTDPARAAVAQSVINAETNGQYAAIEQQRQNEISSLSTILRKHTVDPGESYGGVVRFWLPRRTSDPSMLQVLVKVAGEVHLFRLLYADGPYRGW